jgi:hypothetical protein
MIFFRIFFFEKSERTKIIEMKAPLEIVIQNRGKAAKRGSFIVHTLRNYSYDFERIFFRLFEIAFLMLLLLKIAS